MTKFQIGDFVEIIDEGCVYPNYISFYDDNGHADLGRRHKDFAKPHMHGVVLFSGLHDFGSPMIYAVEVDPGDNGIVLIGESGIELVERAFELPVPEANKDPLAINDLFGITGGVTCR